MPESKDRGGLDPGARDRWGDLKRRIREANSIIDVVGARVRLKKAGKSYKALCPFHSEKTPSFIVNPARQTFKCFGCDEGGDVFSFVMKADRVEFREAMELLADRVGIPMETSPEAAGRARLARNRKLHVYKAQELAQKFFVEGLTSPGGRPAREYLERRALGQLAGEWGLGYAPDRWDGLTGKYGTSPKRERLLVASGLARERETGGVYDYFRGRLMFPIRDPGGRIVGFGGRVIGEGEPKYLNTPETPVFSKGKLLYGLDRAREGIGKSGEALVVEGYTDVIRCHEYGFTNVVATLGTALSSEHVRLLRRFGAERILVTYDADAAGLKAAERGIEVLFEEDAAGGVVTLPAREDGGGLDPCDFLVERGEAAFRESIENARDAFEFKIERVVAGRDMSDVNARGAAADELVELASRSRDPTRRQLLRQRIAEELRLPEELIELRPPPPERREVYAPPETGETSAAETGEAAQVLEGDGADDGAVHEQGAVFDELDAAPPRGPVEAALAARSARETGLDRRAERDLAEALIRWPQGLEVASQEADLGRIEDPAAREVVETLAGMAKKGEKPEARAVLDRLTEDGVRFAVDALESGGPVDPERLEAAVLKTAVAVWRRQVSARREGLDFEIQSARASGDKEKERELFAERAAIGKALSRTRAQVDPETRRKAKEARARGPEALLRSRQRRQAEGR